MLVLAPVPVLELALEPEPEPELELELEPEPELAQSHVHGLAPALVLRGQRLDGEALVGGHTWA